MTGFHCIEIPLKTFQEPNLFLLTVDSLPTKKIYRTLAIHSSQAGAVGIFQF